MIHFDKLSASLRSVTMPYTFVVLLCLLLSSCGLVPNATNSQPTQQQQSMANLQPVNFKTTADEQTPMVPPVQIITFPDMVTPQTLAAVDKLPGGQHFKLKLVVAKKSSSQPDAELEAVEADEADDNEDKDDVEEGDDEDDAFSVQAQKSKPKYTRNDRVFIPETGAFNLTFQAGGDYQVLDGDARDGNAIVQMPREVLAAYLKVRGKFSRDAHKQFPAITRKLSYADPLYYVKQDLTREKKRHGKQTWLSLGNRTLPIPTDWRSVDGDKYILKFNNQGVTRVVMRWYPTKGNAVVTYPPGLNLIGPAGGVVELPGVGKLEIPVGAIATPTVVRMTQMFNAISMPGSERTMGYDYISPVVKIEPFQLQLTKSAKLYLPTDMQRIGRNKPSLMEHVCGYIVDDNSLGGWGHDCLADDERTYRDFADFAENFNQDTPLLIKIFAYYTKRFPAEYKPGEDWHFYIPEQLQSFRIQSEKGSSSSHFNAIMARPQTL